MRPLGQYSFFIFYKKIEILFIIYHQSIDKMTYTHIQLKDRLPTDVWRLISEFNNIVFMNNVIIVDVSRIHKNILPHIYCSNAILYKNYIVLNISKYEKYSVSYNANNKITVTFTRSCSFCKPTCKYCCHFAANINAEEQEHCYNKNCYNECCCIVSFIY
jgi:hypothetical protein